MPTPESILDTLARLTEHAVGVAVAWHVFVAVCIAGLIGFGWVYPHFLEVPTLAYLVAAPVGVVPCPTLALVGGLALLFGGLQSRAVSGILGAASLFYALFGDLRLGVWMDLGLLVGAIALLVLTFWPRGEPAGLPGDLHSA